MSHKLGSALDSNLRLEAGEELIPPPPKFVQDAVTLSFRSRCLPAVQRTYPQSTRSI